MLDHAIKTSFAASILQPPWLVVESSLTRRIARPRPIDTPHTIFFLPGAALDGSWYDAIIYGLRQGGNRDRVEVINWGAAQPIFYFNFSIRSVHHRAEKNLARQITAHRARYPDARLHLIGHSAGPGVILGALAKLDASVRVNHVMLLAPSVSPGYDIEPALRRIGGKMHVFHSERDTAFLKFHTGNTGTYDHVRTAAAGYGGFAGIERLPMDLRRKLVQHPYDPAWEELGHGGGHFGPVTAGFASRVIAPLLAE